MGGDSESASKNTSDSTVLIPIYSNLKNLKFLLASDLVLARGEVSWLSNIGPIVSTLNILLRVSLICHSYNFITHY